MRTHVVIPEELVKEIDELVGKRKRSEFIADTMRKAVQRARLLKVLDDPDAGIDLSRHPEWSTREKAVEWVRALRRVPSSYEKRIAREKRSGSVSPRHKRAG